MFRRHVILDKHAHGPESVTQPSIRYNIFCTRLHVCDTSVAPKLYLHRDVSSNDANLPHGDIAMRPVNKRVRSRLEQRTVLERNITKYFHRERPKLPRS